MVRSITLLICLLHLRSVCLAQYTVPDIKLEALKPKGFRAYIPDTPGIQLFAFHGRKNGPLANTEPGEFSMDVLKPKNNFWVYDDPQLELKVGDKVNYWVFIQHNRLGYRKDDLEWKVEELKESTPLICDTSDTTVNGQQTTCRGNLIFEDSFNNIDDSKWTIESYIPLLGPNYEFNSYENDEKIINVKNNILFIKPFCKENELDLRGTLDLRDSCTSPNPQECFHTQVGAYYLPPVRSAKIRSKFTFKYGKIEIKAKLPAGDWIYPELSLIPKDPKLAKKGVKLVIAYTRGNANLVGNNEVDIGSRLLFAGPVLEPSEPNRSSKLVSRRSSSKPYTEVKHVYSLEWKHDQILARVDQDLIGTIDITKELQDFNSEFYISIGVGIGGINDFPNGYTSSNSAKPWTNKDPKQIKKFFDARNQWLQTWKTDKYALHVATVKVYAI